MVAKAKKKAVRKSVRTPKKEGDRRGTNPKSLANLKPPWKKGGPSPNPGGRLGILSEAYRAWLEESDPKTGKTNAEAVAEAIGKRAKHGEVSAAHEVISATENSKHEVSGPGGGPIRIERTITADQLDDNELASIIANYTDRGGGGTDRPAPGA